jgi:hypothetical protein
MRRLNEHDPRSIEYRLQAKDFAAQTDAAPYRAKNEREHCYSEEQIARRAWEHAEVRYLRTIFNEDDADYHATKEVYKLVFRSVARCWK